MLLTEDELRPRQANNFETERKLLSDFGVQFFALNHLNRGWYMHIVLCHTIPVGN